MYLAEILSPRLRSFSLTVLLAVLGIMLALLLNFFPLKTAGGLLGSLFFLLLTVWKPVWGLAVMSALFSVEGISVQGGITETRLLGIVVFGAWLFHLLIFRKKVRYNRAFLATVGFALWAGLSFLWAPDPESAAGAYGTLLQLALFFLMTINVVESDRDFRLVMIALVLGVLGTSFFSLHLFTTNLFERARVFEGQNPNQYGAVVGMAIVAALYLAGRSKKRWPRFIYLIIVGYLAIPLILAQSRTAWLAVLSSLLVIFWHTGHRLRNFLLVLGAASAIIWSLFAFNLINTTMIMRTSELFSKRSLFSIRIDIWRTATRIIYDHPLAGVGFNQFPVVYNRYHWETEGIRKDLFPRRDPHNLYLGVFAELGIVGLSLMGLIFWHTWKAEKLPPEARHWINPAMLIFVMVSGLGGTFFVVKFFWLALALGAKSQSLARMTITDPGGAG